MHPAFPNKKPNHLQNSFKTFSKPASLKRASLVALPAAISHKVSLKPKRCASATLIQQTSKNEPEHGPKNGTARRSHFWDRTSRLLPKFAAQKEHTREAPTPSSPKIISVSGAKNEPKTSLLYLLVLIMRIFPFLLC